MSDHFQFVSIAVDAQGVDAARPWVEGAGATFPTVIDSENRLAQLYGYKLIPNGIFLDEHGVIRYLKFGGFNIEHDTDRETIQQLIEGKVVQVESETTVAPYELNQTERELVEALMRRGAELIRQGAREAAVAEWKAALRRDPGNLTIRKQIWMARYPERFHPAIDFEWQKEQLECERAEEIVEGVCGPDGCPLPHATNQ